MEIVRLRKNEDPPRDAQRVVVTWDSSGADASEGSVVEHEGGVTFYVPHNASAARLDNVIKKAEEWAVRAGIQKIYVQD